MGTLKEDIKEQSDWIVKAFAADGYNLDYTIKSTMEIDKFFFDNMENGKPKKGGRLPKKGFGPILFSLGSYVGETILQNVPGAEWIADDDDPQGELNVSMKLPDGTIMWPIQRVMKRFQNGSEDSIYPYVYSAVKSHITEKFDASFWKIGETADEETPIQNPRSTEDPKPWWKFW